MFLFRSQRPGSPESRNWKGRVMTKNSPGSGGTRRLLIAGGVAAAVATAALAAETITYRYDARGRLVKVERTGSVNNNVTTDYSHDKADNRTKRETKTGQ